MTIIISGTVTDYDKASGKGIITSDDPALGTHQVTLDLGKVPLVSSSPFRVVRNGAAVQAELDDHLEAVRVTI